LLEPVAQALDALHSLGWVHLDIKPQNILLAKGGRAVLADFGIAQRRGEVTRACTPAYASPEQAAGDRPVGPWSDIYSLGVVLYEMVAGHPPVRGAHDIVLLNQHLEVSPPSPRKVNPQLTLQQERAIFCALAKSPRERYRSAGQLVDDFYSTETRLSSVVKTPNLRLRPAGGRRAGGRRALLLAVVAVLVLIAIVVAIWLVSSDLLATGPARVEPPAVTVPSVLATATASPTLRLTATPSPRPTVTLAPSTTPVPSSRGGRRLGDQQAEHHSCLNALDRVQLPVVGCTGQRSADC
jgi:serine/threonine-protein kinase